MFRGAHAFNQPIGTWDTALVTDMFNMFHGATNFNQNVGNWNTSRVTNMAAMFFNTRNFNNGNTPAVATWQRNLMNWNVSAVTNFTSMFRDSAFNVNISQWTINTVAFWGFRLGNRGNGGTLLRDEFTPSRILNSPGRGSP